MLLSLVIAPAAFLLVSAQQTESALPSGDRMLLRCNGEMRVAGAAPSPITADGLVDLARMRVRGFGMGGEEPIVYLTGTVIGFGSTHGAAQLVEGSIDRASGKTKVVVRAADKPQDDMLAMNLICQFAPPPA